MVYYYIMYPRNKRKKVSVVTKRPDPTMHGVRYGFAEGPLATIISVKRRLNQMNISNFNRPKKFMSSGVD